ncbi:MAG: hypothetical protein EA365_08655 [Gloeocapsa sp. DLM2.Bin57]|nr:MAG: hypothetical protein EA365_08655 [Gloeocapsa sp. DLM2.Bin57]
MFSRDPKDTTPPETQRKLQEPILPSNPQNPLTKNQPQEIVTVIEKISGVLSPYFIVLVGLYLYDNDSWFSFLLGAVLIITGVVSILKISGDDVNKFLTWLKKTLGYDSDENE